MWTKDLARGEQIARRIESGYACVNDANINYFAHELPMGGWKESGLGVRHGAAGIRKYTRQQAILVTRLAMKRDVHFFPYKAADDEAARAADEAAVRARQARLALQHGDPGEPFEAALELVGGAVELAQQRRAVARPVEQRDQAAAELVGHLDRSRGAGS